MLVQAAGCAAAVQANIAVPGMIGARSALDTGRTIGQREGLTAGVGYRPGEPYAKWGRFASEFVASRRSAGQDGYAEREPAGTSSVRSKSQRRRPRSAISTAVANDQVEHKDDVRVEDGDRQARRTQFAELGVDAVARRVHDRVCGTAEHQGHRTLVRDTPPAYLQVKKDYMNAENCFCSSALPIKFLFSRRRV